MRFRGPAFAQDRHLRDVVAAHADHQDFRFDIPQGVGPEMPVLGAGVKGGAAVEDLPIRMPVALENALKHVGPDMAFVQELGAEKIGFAHHEDAPLQAVIRGFSASQTKAVDIDLFGPEALFHDAVHRGGNLHQKTAVGVFGNTPVPEGEPAIDAVRNAADHFRQKQEQDRQENNREDDF